jgi:hypothetical protein
VSVIGRSKNCNDGVMTKRDMDSDEVGELQRRRGADQTTAR